MKYIFVLVHHDAGQEARLQAALDVARCFEGHLNCLDVARLPVMVGDLYGFDTQDRLIEEEREIEAQNRARTEARLIREGVAWDWVELVGDMGPTINAMTDLADLIVLNRKLDSGGPDMVNLAGSVMLGSHKPVLAVPERSRGIDVAGHAVVAWDGSPQAAAALRAALPMLRMAEAVTILTIGDKAPVLSPAEAATYLSRHGLEPEIRLVPAPAADSIPSLLIEQCRQLKAAYLAMGGYGHSRLAEALFGGVTKAMLSTCPVPLLMAH